MKRLIKFIKELPTIYSLTRHGWIILSYPSRHSCITGVGRVVINNVEDNPVIEQTARYLNLYRPLDRFSEVERPIRETFAKAAELDMIHFNGCFCDKASVLFPEGSTIDEKYAILEQMRPDINWREEVDVCQGVCQYEKGADGQA